MLALVITVLAISLASVAALTTLYYGSPAYSDAIVRTAAASLISQGQQLVGGLLLYNQDHDNAKPLTIADLAPNYVSTLPVPSALAYAPGVAAPSAADWEYYSVQTQDIILRDKLSAAVCRDINLMTNHVAAIPATLNPAWPIQCFGSAEPYTFYYDPPLLAAQDASAISANLPALAATPLQLSFTGGILATASAPQSVTLRNAGSGEVTVQSVQGAADFTLAQDSCSGQPLVGKTTCSLDFSFVPTLLGTVDETATVQYYTSTNPQTQIARVALHGDTPDAGRGTLAWQTQHLVFQDVGVGQTETQTSVLTNTGLSAVGLQSMDFINGGGLSVTKTDCGQFLMPAASCNVSIAATPASPYAKTAVLQIRGYNNVTPTFNSPVYVYPAVPAVTNASLNFGAIAVGSGVSLQTLLYNPGPGVLQLRDVAVAGDGFAVSHNCGSTLAVGESCRAQVLFNPLAPQSYSGQLVFSTNGGDQAVALSGTGLLAIASVSPAALDWPATAVGTTSAPRSVVLTNAGNAALTLTGASATGAFGLAASSCGVTLAPGASCAVSVTMTPATRGLNQGTLTLATGQGPQGVALSGIGLQAVPVTSATTLTFGSIYVGSSSQAQSLTLTNNGNTDLGLDTANVTGPFSVDTTCTAQLAAGASCVYAVTFAPTAMGLGAGQLSLPTSAGSQNVTLTGTGLRTSGTASPNTLDFGGQTVGVPSAPVSVTLANTGNTPLLVTSTALAGPFGATHNCPDSLSAGASCTVNVTFTPAAMGVSQGSLTVVTNAGPETVVLTGFGQQTSATFSAATMAFPDEALGQPSPSQSVTLTNTGNMPLTVASATSSGPFAASATTCGTTLSAGLSCSYQVVFTPTVRGLATGTLSVTTGAGVQSVALSGTGLQALIAVNTASLAFAPTPVQTSAAPLSVTLSNSGNTSTTVGAPVASVPFSVNSSTCGSLLAAGTSCEVSVTFTPAVRGAATGTLTLPTGAGTPSVDLTGTGLQAVASLSPSILAYPLTNVGASAAAAQLTLSNTGNTAMTVSAPTLEGAYALAGSTCAASLEAGASCVYSVTFSPTQMGANAGRFTVSTGAGVQTASLSGTGLQAVAATSVSTLAFASTNVGSTSSAMGLTVSNTGNTAMTLGTPTASSPFTLAGSTCGSTLAANASCTLSLTFTPAVQGAASGVLTVPTGAGTQSVALSGTGLASVATLTADALFGSNWYAPSYVYANATYRNDGNTAMTLAPAAVAPFAVASNGCTSVAPGTSCNIRYSLYLANTGGTYSVCPAVTGATSVSACATLSGTILTAVPQWGLSTVAFGSVQVGSSATQNVTLTNQGSTAYDWSTNNGLSNVPSGFSFNTSACAHVAPGGGSCIVQVTFTPSAVGSFGGSGIVPTAASYVSNTLSVSGSGVAPSDATSVGSLNFGSVDVGVSTGAQSVTVTNTGVGAISLSTPYVGTSYYSATHNCPALLAAGSTCTVNVVFSPSTTGTLSDTLTIPSNAGNKTVTLTGTGTPGTVALNYLVVGGGGAADVVFAISPSLGIPANSATGGGGGGEVVQGAATVTRGSTYVVTVAGATSMGAGGSSAFGSLASALGGGFGGIPGGIFGGGAGGPGGSSGGGSTGYAAGANTAGHGYPGAAGAAYAYGGGGGGAGGAASGMTGGPGVVSSLTGTAKAYGAGGNGAVSGGTSSGTAGAANTGQGGSGYGGNAVPAIMTVGASGVVVVSYPLTSPTPASVTGTYTATTVGANRVYTFTSSGSMTF